MLRAKILVAIGANLPAADGASPLDTCRWSIARLAALPGIHSVRPSSWFRSRPHPPSAQPTYVNGAAFLRGTVDPHALLLALHAIEAEAGRRRGAPNAARTLDLDLIAVDDLVIDDAALVLPHPRMHERRFVLQPLAELQPGWIHPILGQSIAALLDEAHGAPLDRLA